MELTPSEQDRLLIFNVAQLAQARRARGVKLNKPEAVALISHAVIEAARDGDTHSQALHAGLTAISDSELLPESDRCCVVSQLKQCLMMGDA